MEAFLIPKYDQISETSTIPDEEYEKMSKDGKKKSNSWHVQRTFELQGPNINLKYFKKTYKTDEEKQFIAEKIKSKKKTELCKNWEIYHDCYFKEECSFAHGIDELRKNISQATVVRNKLCKSFTEKGFCLFGKRCNYRHFISEKQLFTYQSYLLNTANEVVSEFNKEGNNETSIVQVYKRILLNRKIIM